MLYCTPCFRLKRLQVNFGTSYQEALEGARETLYRLQVAADIDASLIVDLRLAGTDLGFRIWVWEAGRVLPSDEIGAWGWRCAGAAKRLGGLDVRTCKV